MNLSQYYYYLGVIHFDDNDLDEARINMQEALELAQTTNEKHLEGNARVLMGRIKGRLGASQHSQAEQLILECHGTLKTGQLWTGQMPPVVGK
jgi:hypothetical protein